MNEQERMRLEIANKRLNEWAERNKKRNPSTRLLTNDQILKLSRILEDWLDGLTSSRAVRTAKKEIHQSLKVAFEDIGNMVDYGFIGTKSPYKNDTWKEDFPAYKVNYFVRALVALYGDEYAIPIAQGIKEGLDDHEGGWESTYEIEVPVIRKARKN
jgi:hypothetical protein